MAAALAPLIANLVHQTTTGTGTGNLTLSTVSGKQSFNTAFGNGATTDVFPYFISNQGASEYERGTGHMSDATTLVRDTVRESTNANAAVNFSAGTKDVVCDVPATRQWYAQEVALASSGTTDLGTYPSACVSITGTTTITSHGSTAPTGAVRFIKFAGALTYTHNATSLIIPGGANITTAAGDCAIVRHEGSGNWRVLNYTLATGKAVVASGISSKLVSFTRDISTASGNQSVTGVGFQPTSIIFIGQAPNISAVTNGQVGSAGNQGSYSMTGNATGSINSGSNVLICPNAANVSPSTTGSVAAHSSFDSDGFTIAWTKNGSPGANTWTFYALCLK